MSILIFEMEIKYRIIVKIFRLVEMGEIKLKAVSPGGITFNRF